MTDRSSFAQAGVLAIVLNWNQSSLSLRCISHLASQSVNLDILLVDNGSHEDDVKTLRSSEWSFQLKCLGDNLGFAAGMNAGIAHAIENRYEYVWLVNNDAFATPECLRLLLARIQQDPTLAMV